MLACQDDDMNEPVTLRRLEEPDSDGVLAAFRSSADMERQGSVRSAEQAIAYVARLLDPANHQIPWAIVDQTDELVGLVVVRLDEANGNGWFWYWMNAVGRGRGWTSRAAATVANWALSHGGIHRLELGHRANNHASRAVALAAGFIQEGVEREKFLVDGNRIDVLTYGRLRTDPVPDIDTIPFR
jgi:RimJ/RimL family protein N-acetyltransferase